MKHETKNKGGRPQTGRNTAVTIRLSDEAIALLNQEPNKSAFLDGLIRGTTIKVKCPHCGNVFTLKTEERL